MIEVNMIKDAGTTAAVFGEEHPYSMMSNIMDMIAERCGRRARASFCDMEGNTRINFYDMMNLIDKGEFIVNIDVGKSISQEIVPRGRKQ